MGTLSKTLAGCGGFLAGDADLIWAIRLLAPAPEVVEDAYAALDVLVPPQPVGTTILEARPVAMPLNFSCYTCVTGLSFGRCLQHLRAQVVVSLCDSRIVVLLLEALQDTGGLCQACKSFRVIPPCCFKTIHGALGGY